MPRASFAHVDAWVFDLDNTLYSPAVRLFEQVEARMCAYMMYILGVDAEEANRLRALYWRRYGTTLTGLIEEHGVSPEPFLEHVHDIVLSGVAPLPALAAAIGALPGRKIVYTNGSRAHARRVTTALGLGGAFDALYAIEDAGFVPKPEAAAFATVFGAAGLAPRRAAMFEDDARNLAVPHGLGMRTVLVGPLAPAPHVEHQTEDLTGFLARLV
jgi:putative hydrolase of the HAD superfamily